MGEHISFQSILPSFEHKAGFAMLLEVKISKGVSLCNYNIFSLCAPVPFGTSLKPDFDFDRNCKYFENLELVVQHIIMARHLFINVTEM